MTGKLWAKLWTDTLHDPKIRRIQPEWRWCWCGVVLLGAESDNSGRLEIDENYPHTDETIADSLAVPLATWCAAKLYFKARGMLAEDGDTLVIANWNKRQSRDISHANAQRNYRAKHGKNVPAENTIAPVGENDHSDDHSDDHGDAGVTPEAAGDASDDHSDNHTDHQNIEYRLTLLRSAGATLLDECRMRLRERIPLPGEDKFNPGAVVGVLYVNHFGVQFPPNYKRLGLLAGQLSGGYDTLATIIWTAQVAQGDPHDYLQGLVKRHPGRKRNGQQPTGTAPTAGRVDRQYQEIRSMMDARQQRDAAAGNGTHDSVGATE
jgi:hypothetical protein